MNSTSIDVVYSSKNAEKIAIEIHGRTGWRKGADGTMEEVIFKGAKTGGVSVAGAGAGEWLTGDDFRRSRKAEAERNREFYAKNPRLLAQKIREHNRGRGKSWDLPGWSRYPLC